jgi:hypothetical protein
LLASPSEVDLLFKELPPVPINAVLCGTSAGA